MKSGWTTLRASAGSRRGLSTSTSVDQGGRSNLALIEDGMRRQLGDIHAHLGESPTRSISLRFIVRAVVGFFDSFPTSSS